MDETSTSAIKRFDEGVASIIELRILNKEVVYFICRCFSLRDFTWFDDCVQRNDISDEVK